MALFPFFLFAHNTSCLSLFNLYYFCNLEEAGRIFYTLELSCCENTYYISTKHQKNQKKSSQMQSISRIGGRSTCLTGGHERYNLRRQERAALEAMIEQAVPLCSENEGEGNGEDEFSADHMIGGIMGSSIHHRTPSRGVNASDPVTVWRIMVFDDVGRDIIAPILKVIDLREMGVTLYLHIDVERDVVQGAPVVYFCEPTIKNMNRIAQDCNNCLYEWVYINFTCELSRESLEYLGQRLGQTSLQSISHIRLFDRTLHYVSLEEDLFSLMLDHSFLTLQNGSNEAIETHISEVVRGLSHVLLSLQLLPVIVHSKTGAAEEIARRLAIRLGDSLQEGQLRPAPSSLFGRPLLLLVDRSHDLASALHHPFTYRGLLSDAASMKLNVARVKIDQEGKVEELAVDPEKDWFYRENGALDFGEIGGRLESAREELQAQQAALGVGGSYSSAVGSSNSAQTGIINRAGGRDVDGLQDGSSNDAMAQLISTAPLLAEKKRLLDAHTKVAYGLLSIIRERKWDVFSGVEREILQHRELDKEMFPQLLKNGGTLEDRQRLYLIAYLMSKENKELARYIQQQGQALLPEMPFPALAYFQFLEKWSMNSKFGAKGGGGRAVEDKGTTAEGFGWGVAQLLAQNLAATLGGTVEQKEDFPLTKMVAALLQNPPPPSASSAMSTTTSSTTLGGRGDPHQMMGGSSTGGGLFTSSNATATRTPAQQMRWEVLQTLSAYDVRYKKVVDLEMMYFSQAVVFSIGGGTVAEYDDLKRWEASVSKKSILYGCTSLITGEELLGQLSELGRGKLGEKGKEKESQGSLPLKNVV